MKKFFLFLTLSFFAVNLIVIDAEAKRMGGGKSFGKQRQSLNQQSTPNQQQAAAPAQNAAAAGGSSKWGGALAGLAAGGLLAALFMGGAFEGINMMDILMLILIAGGIFFIIRMMRKPRTVEYERPLQYSGVSTSTRDNVTQPPFGQAAGTATAGNTETHHSNIPADFKVEPFIRNAKISFIRLQAAYDIGDINDIREYTTPEMLAEISLQIQERGNIQQKSEVMFLDANLLDVETSHDSAIASVRFTGQMRELPDGEPEAFDEIWHVEKNLNDPDSVWLLAGIQQSSDIELT
jgi:predicted lipid-binding transport protein (Tim44 family)